MSENPNERLAALRASSTALLDSLTAAPLPASELAGPSLLPGWTRGHVLSHLARNADALRGSLEGALRGERVQRYPDGPDGRALGIAAGAERHHDEHLADLRSATAALDAAFDAVAAAGAWAALADDRPAERVIDARWLEVEIHRVDLAHDYAARDWPAGFVELMLPRLADSLPARTGDPVRVEVAPDGSVSPLAGRSWTVEVAASDPVLVRGPDWAVLAWLVGRPAAASPLNAPPLTPWL